MPRLVCIVEGHGDVEAVPILCARLLRHFGAHTWSVDKHPVRQPRPELVDVKVPSPHRPPGQGLRRAVALARERPADAILVLCDADDDCAATWGPQATSIVRTMGNGAAVMAVREYESWLVAAAERSAYLGVRSIESIRGAKEQMRRRIGGYKPAQHQAECTRKMDIVAAWASLDSFDKLVRTLTEMVGVELPERPVL